MGIDVDVVDPPCPPPRRIAELRANSGAQFSPAVVEALIRVVDHAEPGSTGDVDTVASAAA
jgi:HD-GYP domain-containing protein (c-di-GMP phosphodiesterase class II)